MSDGEGIPATTPPHMNTSPRLSADNSDNAALSLSATAREFVPPQPSMEKPDTDAAAAPSFTPMHVSGEHDGADEKNEEEHVGTFVEITGDSDAEDYEDMSDEHENEEESLVAGGETQPAPAEQEKTEAKSTPEAVKAVEPTAQSLSDDAANVSHAPAPAPASPSTSPEKKTVESLKTIASRVPDARTSPVKEKPARKQKQPNSKLAWSTEEQEKKVIHLSMPKTSLDDALLDELRFLITDVPLLSDANFDLERLSATAAPDAEINLDVAKTYNDKDVLNILSDFLQTRLNMKLPKATHKPRKNRDEPKVGVVVYAPPQTVSPSGPTQGQPTAQSHENASTTQGRGRGGRRRGRGAKAPSAAAVVVPELTTVPAVGRGAGEAPPPAPRSAGMSHTQPPPNATARGGSRASQNRGRGRGRGSTFSKFVDDGAWA